jgi:hypothetical protein
MGRKVETQDEVKNSVPNNWWEVLINLRIGEIADLPGDGVGVADLPGDGAGG